jgi:hypothetical protein
MDEQREYAILFAATILSARKLLELEPDKPGMAKGYIVVATGTAVVAKAFAIRE